MLNLPWNEAAALRAAQAAGAAVLALAVALVARRSGIRLGKETVIALARGLGQIVAIGLLLTLVLGGARWISAFVLLGMMLAGAVIAARRTRKHIPGIFQVTASSILIGAGVVICVMVASGVIDTAPGTLIPVESMLDRQRDEHNRAGA